MPEKLSILINNPTVKKHFLLTLLGTFLGVSVYYYIVSNENFIEKLALKDAFLATISGILLTYLIRFLTKKLDILLPWKTQIGNRLAAGIIIGFLVSYLLIFCLFYGYQQFVIGEQNTLVIYEQVLIKLGIILFIITFLFSIIYFALYSYYAYSTLQIETVKQERKHIDLRLSALKSQLSPHFLFNSLNTISSLSFKDPSKAESFIRGLAKIYKYTLDSYTIELTSLREELELVHSYLYLLQTRFEDKLSCSIAIPEDLKMTKIPPLTLQMLLENAVKHNQLSSEDPLKITIGLDDGYIFIRNNITGNPNSKSSFRIGLENINSRYLLLTNQGIVTSNGQEFTVKLPLIY